MSNQSEEILNLFLSEMTKEPLETVFTVIKANAIRDLVRPRTVYPVELSLAAFTLTGGVINAYSTLIDVGQIPAGNGFSAKVLNEETGLPLLSSVHFQEGHREYERMAGKIFELTKEYRAPGLHKPRRILFALRADLEEAADSVKWLSEKCGLGHREVLQQIVYVDLSKLFLRLATVAHKDHKAYFPAMVQFNNPVLAEKELERAIRLSFRNEITCPYHIKEGAEKMDMCAKNVALRRVFRMLDELAEAFEVKKNIGHFPSNYCINLMRAQ